MKRFRTSHYAASQDPATFHQCPRSQANQLELKHPLCDRFVQAMPQTLKDEMKLAFLLRTNRLVCQRSHGNTAVSRLETLELKIKVQELEAKTEQVKI